MRIKFEDNRDREEFFEDFKSKSGKLWKEIIKELDVTKSTLERYKNGKSLIPKGLFNEILKQLDKTKQEYFLNKIEELPDNLGQIKGGKVAYKINYEKFKEGRKKGLRKLRILKNKGRKKQNFNFDNLTFDQSFYEVIGAFIGDGFFNCYNNKLYQVEFAGDSRYDLDYYDKIIIPKIKEIISNVNPHIYKVKNKNSIRVVFYSKEFFCLLKDYFNFSPGVKTYTIYIPDKIILKNRADIFRTIRGIFDTDGGVFLDRRERYKKPYPRIALQTVSKPLFYQLKYYLSKEFKIYSRHNEKRNIYVLEIYGINQLKKWMSLIGFSNKRHLDKVSLVTMKDNA